MPGPAPKDPALRQRRNRASTKAVLTRKAPQRERAPYLPRGYDWHKLTRAWWKDVWSSPMAAEYLRADMHGLYRLALLIDRFWEDPSTKLAAEIRLEQQAFGLTPLDRRRLQWSIEQAESATAQRHQRRVRDAQSGSVDPRQALKVVGE